MKCEICKGKTNWDSSYGYADFLVCYNCFNRLTDHKLKNTEQVMNFLFKCGQIRKAKLEKEKIENV